MTLPRPACRLGYTDEQVRAITGERYAEFEQWHAGQTGGVCDGRTYDRETDTYAASGCGPHGFTVYSSDLRQFLAGGDDLEWECV